MIPNEIAEPLERRLRVEGHGELADSIKGLPLYAVAVGDGPVGLQVAPSPADREGATGIRLGDTWIEIADGRVVYIETDAGLPVRRLLRRLSPQSR